MVGIYIETRRVEVYTVALFTDPEGDSFNIYQISWIKMKKVNFFKLKTSRSRNFVYNKQFGILNSLRSRTIRSLFSR